MWCFSMDRSFLMIAALVFLVGFVGFMTVSGGHWGGITGNVVREAPDQCDACHGTWVCAAKDGKVSNYASACAARCADARIVYGAACERIIHANNH